MPISNGQRAAVRDGMVENADCEESQHTARRCPPNETLPSNHVRWGILPRREIDVSSAVCPFVHITLTNGSARRPAWVHLHKFAGIGDVGRRIPLCDHGGRRWALLVAGANAHSPKGRAGSFAAW